MARPAKDQVVDLTRPATLSVGLLDRLVCPPGKKQAFLRDAATPGLRVRVSDTGTKTFVVERKIGQQTVRRAIGDIRAWSIQAAQGEARRLHALIGQGVVPEARTTPPVVPPPPTDTPAGTAWAAYIADRRDKWGVIHLGDHLKMSDAGGKPFARGKGTTKPGVLRPLLVGNLCDITPVVVDAWATEQARTRATSARLALRMFSAFLNWCREQPEFAADVPAGALATKSRRTREALGKAKPKQDALLREQLPAWFAAARTLTNATVGAYLQVLLLTGARPGEVRALRWADVDWAWRGMGIQDKVEGARVIPLTPYVAALLSALPRRNQWVFSSDEAASGALASPNKAHHKVCLVAGIAPLTLHGLRRSFKSLTEWLDMPAGAVAQIMGHKPSATAEKHYTVRPLDLLRVHHERIEAWVLEQAGVELPTVAFAPRLVCN